MEQPIIKQIFKDEYFIRSNILINICKHIENLHKENIIHQYEKNKLLDIVNTCVILLHSKYNTMSGTDTLCIDKNILKYGIYIYPELYTMINVHFYKIDEKIYELFHQIGSYSIEDIFKLRIGKQYRSIMGIDKVLYCEKSTLYDFTKQINNSPVTIDFLINYFVPINMSYSSQSFKNIYTTVLIKQYPPKCELLLENSYKITIKCIHTKNIFVFFGLFSYIPANIILFSSQISNNYIYYKKKLLVDYVNETNIDNEYKTKYLSNLTIGDILSHKGNELRDKLHNLYTLYTKYINMKFKDIINEFMKMGFYNKYLMLKCFLFGSEQSNTYASFLFSMTKDIYKDYKYEKLIIADILYKNLSHISHCKFKKNNHIEQEIIKLSELTINNIDFKQQCILNNNIDIYVKKCIINKIDEMKINNNDYHKNLLYVKTLLDYPWISNDYNDIFTSLSKDMSKCKAKLEQIKNEFNKQIYGQTEFKTVICDIVGKWLTTPNSISKAIGLCGPPGCGKTLVASCLGKILNIPYQEIHLGGMEDASVLNGHSYTYSGAQPGLIITKMVMAGQPRCILFFDELDKSCYKNGINEIYNVLIHCTDPNTNTHFNDKFFQDIAFPLNMCIFIFSFNDVSKIDPILKERMEIINIMPYSVSDKIEIAKQYLIPYISTHIGIKDIHISPSLLEYIITEYTMEAGVRSLKTYIEKIFLKLNIDRIYGSGIFVNKNINLTKRCIIKYLGPSNITIETIHKSPQIGIVNGLYTTDSSGGIMPILIYPSKGITSKFTLELTGKQGDVMKESVSFAWTIAKNSVKQYIIDDYYKNNKSGLHIHTPEGAVTKDGPSAGCAFVIAFISRLTNLPIKNEIAMTGEISINGKITAIGGLEFKLFGAKKAGVRLVFICKDNIKELKLIKKTNPNLFDILDNNEINKKKIQIIIVESIFDIVPYALYDKDFVASNYTHSDVIYNKTCKPDFMSNSIL